MVPTPMRRSFMPFSPPWRSLVRCCDSADWLKDNGSVRIEIEGHCDERGTEEYNLVLGEERARAIRKYLSGLGVSRGRIRIVSKGEVQPLDSSSNEGAWATNRRAEFIEQ